MKWRLLGVTLLISALGIGGTGRAQTKPKTTPPASKASAKNPLDSFQTFSATLNGGIGHDHDRKIFRSGNLMRADFADSYRIIDIEKQITLGVDKKSCRQYSAPDAASYPFAAYRNLRVERSLTTEKETVDGHTCVIENITFTPSDDHPFEIRMKLFEAEDLQHFPIKIVVESVGAGAKSGRKMEILYTNVSLETPDPNLFKHPAHCELDMALALPTSGSKAKGREKSSQ